MTRSKSRDLGAQISHVVGLDRATGGPPFSYDPEAPVTPHESHAWVHLDRWAACETCGARDHWPGAGDPCVKPQTAPAGRIVGLGEAVDQIHADAQAFAVWWVGKALGPRPASDWNAEFFEWRRVGAGRG